jgi:hypothetical protein
MSVPPSEVDIDPVPRSLEPIIGLPAPNLTKSVTYINRSGGLVILFVRTKSGQFDIVFLLPRKKVYLKYIIDKGTYKAIDEIVSVSILFVE